MAKETVPADQGLLNAQLAEQLTERQKSLQIVKTTTSPSGQLLDWVPIESQVPGGKIATPPPLAAARVDPLQRKSRPVTFELDASTVERGGAGTVPVVRPDISRLSSSDRSQRLPCQAWRRTR